MHGVMDRALALTPSRLASRGDEGFEESVGDLIIGETEPCEGVGLAKQCFMPAALGSAGDVAARARL